MTVSTQIAPVVALDIGNVCIELRHEECARHLGFDSLAALLRTHPFLLRLLAAWETGHATRREFFHGLRHAFGNLDTGEEELSDWWRALLGSEIAGTADLVREMVAEGLRPVFFSDVSDLHYEMVLPMLSFAELITGAVVSYRVGCRKPAPGMYEALEREFCAGGCPMLYIDDKPENIEAAQERGWNAYRFGSVAGATEALRNALQRNLPV